MAPQHVVKSLNKGPGSKRFVFKSFSQRVEEVDIDVFRSLTPVKCEPTSGSSFFHENLLRWRELNAAADFNAVYVELLPIVQTMPQLLLHKDAVMKSLLSRVRLSALLSLEPILSLIPLLSRDLREEFLPYMSNFLDVCYDLLRSGGDQEPDLLEQVFVSISYVIKYLMIFLTKDILFVLRVTKSLRYYRRTFVQDFLGESVSYLLRKAPPKQLIKGVKRLFTEVEADPKEIKTTSCSTLLFHTLKGPASGLHSQAETLLHLLLDRSIVSGIQRNKHGNGRDVALQVVSKTFLMLCEHVKREKLEVLWVCLVEHISVELGASSPIIPSVDPAGIIEDSTTSAVKNEEPFDNGAVLGLDSVGKETVRALQDKCLSEQCGPGTPLMGSKEMLEENDVHCNELQGGNDRLHFVHLLSLLTDVLEFRKGSCVNDYEPLFFLVPRLLNPEVLSAKQSEPALHSAGPISPFRLFQDWVSEFLSEVFRFLLALVQSHARVAGASRGPGFIATVAPTWSIAFNCNRVNCLLPFLSSLIEQDVTLVRIFTPDILRSLDHLMEDYPVDVLPLLLELSQKMELVALILSNSNTKSMKTFIICLIEESMKGFKAGGLKMNSSENVGFIEILALDPAVLWMAIKCLPSVVGVGEEQAALVWKFAVAVEHFLSCIEEVGAFQESEDISTVWECLLAAALSSHTKILIKGNPQILMQHVVKYIDLAVLHKKCPHVLKAVGELLDASEKDVALDASSRFSSLLQDFGPNLSVADKSLRTATLKILSYYEGLQKSGHDLDKSPSKRQKGNDGQANEKEGSLSCKSFQQLFVVESSILSHENVRQSNLLITAVKVTICARNIPDTYVVPLFNALIGLLHNRFSLLWDSVMAALTSMLRMYGNSVWPVLLSHLEKTQNSFLYEVANDRKEEVSEILECVPSDLWTRFDSYLHDNTEGTQTGTLLALQLKTLQKVAIFSEARSRQLIPLFLRFVGHFDNPEESHEAVVGAGKAWKAALKEWLNLIKEMRNARSLFRGPVVKEILLSRFLSDSDPAVQLVALEGLLNWKDRYLTSSEEHLKNLISSKVLREELTTWDISKESHLILDEDRELLLDVVLLILFPKIMRRTIKSMGKSGVGVQRNAVLSFLARLESGELAPLFAQLMKPLQSAFTVGNSTSKFHHFSNTALVSMLKEGVNSEFVEKVDRVAVAALPYKRKLGFLHMVMDSLEIFNPMQLAPYLHALLAIVLRLLETCAVNSKDESSASVTSDGMCDAASAIDGKGCFTNHLENKERGQVQIGCEVSSVPELANTVSIGEDVLAICSSRNAELIVFETVQQVAFQLGAIACNDVEPHSADKNEPLTNLLKADNNGSQEGVDVNDGKSQLLREKSWQMEHDDDNQLLEDLAINVVNCHGGGVREIKALCFKILATVVRKFENVLLPPPYWDIFFNTIQQSAGRFVDENRLTIAPSALMQCFMAMSQRMELAPLLARNPDLVRNILLMLSVRGLSGGVISAILKFVENILDLVSENDVGEETEAVKGVLMPHMDVLLLSFGECLSFHRETSSEKRSLKRELNILTRISKYIEDTVVTEKLLDVLLPMLRIRKRMEQELCLEVLHLLQGIGPNLQIASSDKCLPVLAPLLASMSIQDGRIAVCETLMALAKVDHALLNVAELMTDLNSMSSSTIDEFDYGRRLLAYDHISGSFFSQLTRAQALLVLSHVIYDMGSEDMSIRHRASDCLQMFVRFAASFPDDKEDVPRSETVGPADEPYDVSQGNDDLISESLKAEEPSTKVAMNTWKSLVTSFLFPHTRNGVGSDLLLVRREWVLLLREMAASFTCGATLREYYCLLNNDLEADFFHNIVHLQVHRRIKAMSKFKVMCSSSHFSQGSLSRIFVPLFMNILFEARGDKEGNLVTVAVEILACIATQLPWEPYFGLLMRCFQLLVLKPDHQKVLVRVVCAILDAFHFFLPLSGNENEKGNADLRNTCSENGQIGKDLSLPSADNSVGKLTDDHSAVILLPANILSLLQRRVLPEIRNLMVSKVGIVSTPVALTQVKILKLMPENIVEIELPQVVRTVINALKSRSQAVRDEARAALVAITETLGANYLHFVIDVLRTSLIKGFELHVLGYSLNSILVKLVPKLKVGEIDYCLEQLLEVLENDIVGEVAEEKDVEAIAVKMKETKRMRSFESLKLLAQVVTFQTQAITLLGPVRRNLQKTLGPKLKPKLENMLQHIAMGLQINPSVNPQDLFVIVYAMVEDGVKEEKSILLIAAAKKQARIDRLNSVNSTGESLPAMKAPIPHFYLITEYALQLLHNHLKRVKVNPHNRDTLAMLNPLVGLLQECLNSKFNGVLASALKVLSLLLLLPLPAIDLYGSKITTLVFSICQRFVKRENSLLQACFSVLIILIRQCKSLRLSEDQLRALLQFPIFQDMEGGSRMALALLKSIVSRKLLVPELYDMINRVAQLMVTSYAGPVRQLCSQILLQFLLDYPLGKKRLQEHINFFITNVGYVETSGREASLEMLHTVILKFPLTVVEEHAESMFFPLVMRLVNDESNEVRSMIGTILKVLMGRVGPRLLQHMVEFGMSWYKGVDVRLWRTAAQVLGFLIEVMGRAFERYVQDVLPQCIKILEWASFPQGGEELDSDQTGKELSWQDAYYSLTMMEKLLQQLPNFILLPDLKKFWISVSSLLLHQHLWIRKACGRMLSIYFKTCGIPNHQILESAALGEGDILFFHPSWILLLAASLCQQLDSSTLDDAMGDQLVKILEIIGSILHLLPQSVPRRSPEKPSFLGCDDVESQGRVSRALFLLGWEGTSQNGVSISGDWGKRNPSLEGIENGKHGMRLMDESTPLSLVFKKLQKIALRVHPMQTKVILRWYAAIAPKLMGNDMDQYLQSMLVVLVKITEGSAAKVVPEDVKSLGDGVLNQLRELTGAAKFVNTYNAVREKGKQNRDKRKRAEKISVLVDPEQNAKRKIRMTAKRQSQKKLKIMKGKVQMGL